jgi:uncharacterized protein with ACT and thioredoxin-like domain
LALCLLYGLNDGLDTEVVFILDLHLFVAISEEVEVDALVLVGETDLLEEVCVHQDLLPVVQVYELLGGLVEGYLRIVLQLHHQLRVVGLGLYLFKPLLPLVCNGVLGSTHLVVMLVIDVYVREFFR